MIDHKVNYLRNEFSNWYFELQNQIPQKNDTWSYRCSITPNTSYQNPKLAQPQTQISNQNNELPNIPYQIPNLVINQPQNTNQNSITPNLSYQTFNPLQPQTQSFNHNGMITTQPKPHTAFSNTTSSVVPQGNPTYTILQNVSK